MESSVAARPEPTRYSGASSRPKWSTVSGKPSPHDSGRNFSSANRALEVESVAGEVVDRAAQVAIARVSAFVGQPDLGEVGHRRTRCHVARGTTVSEGSLSRHSSIQSEPDTGASVVLSMPIVSWLTSVRVGGGVSVVSIRTR